MDEPSTGLDRAGVRAVQSNLHEWCALGHAVVIVTHDLGLIRGAHHVVELGPGGGPDGGRRCFEGSPEALARADTATGQALRSGR
jgi:excinuclease ABC subunit A